VPWFRDQYADAVRDSKYALRPNEKLVALIYADHAGDPENPGNDVAWVSWGRLSEQTGIRSKDALNRAVRHLEKRGWLQLVEARKQHRSPRYRLVIPDEPEVRAAYVWDGSEVREEDLSTPVDNPASGTGDVPLKESSGTPDGHLELSEVRETTPEVRETTSRGTPDGPDPSTNPSTTPISGPETSNYRPRAKPKCKHQWSVDHYCSFCQRHEPCPDCRRLARINDTIRCHQHQPAQEAS
jgi:hypothetical protein